MSGISRCVSWVVAGLCVAGPAVAGPTGKGGVPGAVPAGAAPAQAPPAAAAPAGGPDLSVRDAELAGFEGRRARLNVFLRQPGAGQTQDQVTVYWVEGNRKERLWQGQSRFSGSRDGFMHQVEIDLPERRSEDGHLEVVAGEERRDPNFGNNVKRVQLSGGDLAFEGRPEITQRAGGNPNREVRIVVKNRGPGTVQGCKVELNLAEQGPARKTDHSLPALRPGAEHSVSQRYHYRESGNRAHNSLMARIVCARDPVPGNNQTTFPLR